jgi:hypothetical protein
LETSGRIQGLSGPWGRTEKLLIRKEPLCWCLGLFSNRQGDPFVFQIKGLGVGYMRGMLVDVKMKLNEALAVIYLEIQFTQ